MLKVLKCTAIGLSAIGFIVTFVGTYMGSIFGLHALGLPDIAAISAFPLAILFVVMFARAWRHYDQ